MENLLKDYVVEIGEARETGMNHKYGIYQDGTTPMYRDTDGKLWAMSGHTHMGHISMLCGTCVEDLREVYPVEQKFCTGDADFAFSGVRYPEGVKARGSVWPFALYICPNTHRFYSFFHNETGWHAHGTEYDSYGKVPKDTAPRYDSDFRHIGMMHSDNEGKTWTFDRWVLSGDNVCFTEKYNPGAGNILGQKEGIISLGSGDFSFFVDHKEGFLYLFYNVVRVDMKEGGWDGCDVFVARSRLRADGSFGDFVKYYNGAFCEAGNLGKETAVAKNSWHARVTYSNALQCYIMSSVGVNPGHQEGAYSDKIMYLRTSEDMLHWSDPVAVTKDGKGWGDHYVAMAEPSAEGAPYVLKTNEFVVLTNSNGTNVTLYPAKFVKKA